ncbi:CLUMA_CG013014, isoform A [Clunio marinus]|uniref:CLUMA_CG013014, isoform A n=1 Tax=Clunio marinus TaxID=568069 RepID=A0A1J1IJ05_9DIPT|nr:CLUMA_CG013014, isoform A [Clunio marinus]
MELVCKFNYCYWYTIGSKYTSIITSSSITEPNTIIKTINGNHLEGKSDKDIEEIWFNGTTVNYFPQGLNKIFPNLKTVIIDYCGLKSITRRDLVGLENIQMLWCGHNKIASLPDNLFRNMNKLIYISFYDNDLHCMSSEVLKPILKNDLKYVDFSENRSIDAGYRDSSYTLLIYGNKVDSVAQLMAMIDEKCDKPMKDEQTFSNTNLKDNKLPQRNKKLKDFKSDGFKELWTTGRFSDITIVTDTEKFKVHKNILAIQSSVFTSIFEDKMKDRPSDEIHLKNINVNIVTIFLKFFYTDEVDETEISNLLEVFALAAKFKVENLMSVVEKMITDDLNDDNAMDVFKLACRFNCDGMKTSAFEVIQSMFDEPLKDELMNQPEVIFESIFRCEGKQLNFRNPRLNRNQRNQQEDHAKGVDKIADMIESANVQNCGHQIVGGEDESFQLQKKKSGEAETSTNVPAPICRPGYTGRSCDIISDICLANEPCEHGGICTTMPDNNYHCDCTLGYTGENCQHMVALKTKARFKGDGYLELNRSTIATSSSQLSSGLAVLFSTKEPNGLILWYGQERGKGFNGEDFLSLAVNDGILEFTFRIDGEESVIKHHSVPVIPNRRHIAILKRTANQASLELDGFTEYGETARPTEKNEMFLAGHVFLGGAPDLKRFTGERYSNGFIGCIHTVEPILGGAIQLGENTISSLNVDDCSPAPDNEEEDDDDDFFGTEPPVV